MGQDARRNRDRPKWANAVRAALTAWKMRKTMESTDMTMSCQAIVPGRSDELDQAAHERDVVDKGITDSSF